MSSELPQSWRRWVAENVILGVSDDQIFNEATAAGMKRELVSTEIRKTGNDPYIEAGRRLAQRAAKIESMLQVPVELAPEPSTISRAGAIRTLRGRISAAVLCANRPVKLLGMLSDWPAMHKWSPTYFRSAFRRRDGGSGGLAQLRFQLRNESRESSPADAF